MFPLQPAPTPTPSPAATAVVTPTPTVEVTPSVVPTTGSPLPLPAEAVDSTPLLSTLVQSGAALVAIIAGLLIARLVALVGERNSLERRVRELAEVVVVRRKEYAEAHRDRLDDDAYDFIDHVLEQYFSEEEPTFEKFYDSYDDDPGDGEKLRPYYDRFVLQVQRVANEIESSDLLVDERTGWSDDHERDRVLARFAEGRERDIADVLLDGVEAEWKDRRRRAREQLRKQGLGALAPRVDFPQIHRNLLDLAIDPAITSATRQITSARYLQLKANEANAKSAMEDAERDLGHAREALASLSKPEGLVFAIALLGGIAVAGIVLPLIQLTVGGTALSAAGRWVYTGFFLASLAAFFGYLGAEIVRLNKPPKTQVDTSPEGT